MKKYKNLEVKSSVGSDKIEESIAVIDCRYRENPFLLQTINSVRIRNKRVSLSSDTANAELGLIDQKTGELLGRTQITTVKLVDEEEFVKIFTREIRLAFELSSAGYKALWVLIYAMQQNINKDSAFLDTTALEDFLRSQNSKSPEKEELTLSYSTFSRGLRELVKSNIIAKSVRRGEYFINPSFAFNGNRIEYINIVQKRKMEEEELPLEVETEPKEKPEEKPELSAEKPEQKPELSAEELEKKKEELEKKKRAFKNAADEAKRKELEKLERDREMNDKMREAVAFSAEEVSLQKMIARENAINASEQYYPYVQ